MERFAKVIVLSVLVLIICLPGIAAATYTSSTANFGAAITQGFEGITPGSTNTSSLYNGSWFNINITPPYVFGNGATLSAPPAVNYSIDNAGPYIHDFYYGAGIQDVLGFPAGSGNGIIGSAPFGNAYLGIWRDTSYGPFSLIFKFDQNVTRAGAYFTGWPEGESGTYYLRALDASGNVLESYTISTVNVSTWATNFVGVERAAGFRQLEFLNPTYGQTVLDNVMFQPVPIPAAGWLLGSGLIGLVAVRRRVKK